MKIFISADIEGITGVTSWCQVKHGAQGYDEACRIMTQEVCAACDAAIEMGYEVVVKDGHGDAINIDIAALPRGTQLIRGWRCSPEGMMGGLDESFAGVIYIGYHSAAGMATSPLAHTVDSSRFNWVKLNEALASEFSLNALYADSLGVPSLFISGDKGICDHAQNLYNNITVAAVKECTGNSTWNKHPEEAQEMIKKGVVHALQNIRKPDFTDGKIILEMNFRDHQKANAASYYPGAQRIDENTVKYIAKNVNDFMTAKMFMFEI